MADANPSRGEVELQLAAAREAIERLAAGVVAASDHLIEQDVDQLRVAVDELEELAEEVDQVRSGRREAALEAAGQRRRYEELFELAPDGYVITDQAGVILQANRAAAALLEVPAERLAGKPLLLYFDDVDRQLFHRQLGTALRAGAGVVEWQATARPRQGEATPVAVRCSASDGDRPHTLRFLLHDLTSVRRAEQRERAAIEAQAERAQSLEQAKSNFLRLASHELRGPLALIRGYLSMLSDGTFGALPDEASATLPVLLARVEEMSRMVDEMLDTARIEDGRLQLRSQRLDMAEIAHAAVESMQPLAADSHEIVLQAGTAVPVNADRRRLTTIITNLLDNAIKYSPEGGEVGVRVGCDDGYGEVAVQDYGLGIARRELESIFKPFGRVVTSETSHIPGTGLGLYLSRELARAQGGELFISSVEGQGTTATLRIPLAS